MDYNGMKYCDLKKLCKEKGVSGKGKKTDLIKRLNAQAAGSVKFIPGMTLCKVCRKQAAVMKTEKQKDDFGRTIIVRHMRCSSKHRHSYKLTEIVKG